MHAVLTLNLSVKCTVHPVRSIHRTLGPIHPVYGVRRLCERPSIWFLSHPV